MNLPYRIKDFAGIGGTIKNRAEDFFVQELPLYEPSGEGEHVYCEIQKVGMTTFDAINRIAAGLGVTTRDIGYAGMKDARAVSRQLLSIFGTNEQAVMDLKIPGIAMQWAARHGNKLRLGHLRANLFAIRIRDVDPNAVFKAKPVFDDLVARGMPNYFGEQRFGRRGDNDELGAALIAGDNKQVLHLLLGNPKPGVDDGHSITARTAFDANDFSLAMKTFPRRNGMERRILARFMKTKRPGASIRAIDERLRHLWVSALQSKLFNDVVAARIETLDKVMDGDLAYKHENGSVFLVESAETEQPRCDAFDISPTGPLVGYRMTMPANEPLVIETGVLDQSKLKPEDFRAAGRLKVKGARRPMRTRPTEPGIEGGVDEHGPFVLVIFTLPAGSFATVLLRELMRNDASTVETEDTEPSEESTEA